MAVRKPEDHPTMKLMKSLFIAAAFAIMVGVVGNFYVWLTSSSVKTEQYSHTYSTKFRGWTEPRTFYVTESQAEAIRAFEVFQGYGLGFCLGCAALMWLLYRLNKNARLNE